MAQTLFLLFIMRHVASYCAGFNVMGYKGDYQSTKNGKLLCAVSCDTALGYFPDELAQEFNGTITYHTIYERVNGQWKPKFEGTEADMVCRFGCYAFPDDKPPNYLRSSQSTIITSEPRIKYGTTNVECSPGYFTPRDANKEDENIKMRMVCARTHRDSTDKWMWDKKVANKIECRRGCRRAGLIRPVHQSGYGAKSACKHVGIPQHGDSDLVSSCEFSCDTDNGFKEIDEKFMLLHCDKNGEFADFPLNFHCEQGCNPSPSVAQVFKRMHMTLDCKRNKGDRWVNSCAVECEKDYVIGERGKMGKRDIVKCIKGVVNTHTTKMDCRRKCTKYPDSCDFPESCIGENEYDQPFCSTTSVKFYPPKN